MLSMIWAQGHNRAIGKDGTLPWNVPEDMAMFKRLTMGHPVIMGRKTWESLSPRWRPLPGRANYVVSRNRRYQARGATVMPSLEEALTHAYSHHKNSSQTFKRHMENALNNSDAQEKGSVEKIEKALIPFLSNQPTPLVWLIGGAQLYAYACETHLATLALVTDLDCNVPNATAYAPQLSQPWAPVYSSPAQGWLHSDQANINYRFTLYYSSNY